MTRNDRKVIYNFFMEGGGGRGGDGGARTPFPGKSQHLEPTKLYIDVKLFIYFLYVNKLYPKF